MNKNNQRSGRANQTARLHSVMQQAAPWSPLFWLALMIFINMIYLQWMGVSISSIVLLVFSILWCWTRFLAMRRYRRQQWIEGYVFPSEIWQNVHPVLSAKKQRLVERGLKDFFLLHTQHNGRLLMPSKAVDALWHEFILDTKAYEAFCQHAFGRILHHHPSYRMSSESNDQHWCMTWRGCCVLEGMNPSETTSLPRLFVMDEWVEWPNTSALQVGLLTQRYREWQATQSDSGSGGGDASSADTDSGDGGGCGGGCGGD